MEVDRYRFAHYQPQGVTSMALTHDGHVLAVARENNSLEVWLVASWSQLLVVPGNKNCDVRNIHWLEPGAGVEADESNHLYYKTVTGKAKKRRLITTGLNGQAIEWNLASGTPRARLNVHSAIWDSKMHGKYLYVAQEGGSIKIIKAKKTKLELVRSLVKADSRCLSLELEREADEKSIVKSLFGGYADSSIRRWDLASGNSVLHFEKSKKKECLIWQLRTFLGGYLISGDSQGDVCFWDARFGTLIKKFSNLKGDVNALEINVAGRTVYASGADSRVVAIQLEEEGQSWVFASMCRGQSHDVRSLLLLNEKQLLSAGVTTDICIYNLVSGRFHDQFGKDSKQQQMAPKLRHIAPFPFKTVAKADNESVCIANGRSLDLWSTATHQQLLQIQKKGDFNLSCFDKLGGYIVYSDTRDTQVFLFDHESLKLQKLTQLICASNGIEQLPPAVFLRLYDEQNLLLVDSDLNVCKVRLSGDFKYEVLGNLSAFLPEAARSYDRIVTLAHFNSKTSQLFVQFACLDTFLLINVVGFKLLWSLPSMNRELPLCMQADQDKLVVCYDSNKVVVFDLLNQKLHDWSKRARFPQNYLNRFNRIVGIAQVAPKKFILYSHYTYITLNLAQDVPTKEVLIIQNHPGKSLEERGLAAKSWFESLKLSQAKYLKETAEPQQEKPLSEEVPNLTISNKLKGILSMEYDEKEQKLVVVENMWKKLVQAFPGAVAVPKYGL